MAMESFEAETIIDARSCTVWDIITDAANYTVWPSGITFADGHVRNGSSIRIRTRTGGNRALRLRVRLVPGKVMTWTASFPLGFFSAVRTFTLSPREGKTQLRVKDEFRGPLLRLAGRTLPDLGRDCSGYIDAVKERAEQLG